MKPLIFALQFFFYISAMSGELSLSEVGLLRAVGQSHDAIRMLEKLPPDAIRDRAIVQVLFEVCDFKGVLEAADRFDRYVNRAPFEDRCLVKLLQVQSFWILGRVEEAFAQFERQIQVQPSLLPLNLFEGHRNVFTRPEGSISLDLFREISRRYDSLENRRAWLGFAIAQQFRRAGEYEHASEILSKALVEKADIEPNLLASLKLEKATLQYYSGFRDKSSMLFSEIRDNAGLSDDVRARGAYWNAIVQYVREEYKTVLPIFIGIPTQYPNAGEDVLAASLLQVAWCHVQLKNIPEAAETFSLFRKRYPKADETLRLCAAYGESMLLHYSGKTAEGIEASRNAWKALPNASPAVLALGRLVIASQVYAADGRTQEAEEMAREAVGVYEAILKSDQLSYAERMNYLFGLIEVYKSINRLDAARPALIAVLHGVSFRAQYTKGKYLEMLANSYASEIESLAESPNARTQLSTLTKKALAATVLWKQPHAARVADAALRRLAAIQPEKPLPSLMEDFKNLLIETESPLVAEYAALGVAKMLHRSKKNNEAENLFKEILKRNNDPFRADSLCMAAVFLCTQNKDEEAIPLLEELTTKYPDSAYAAQGFYLLGWIAFTKNERENAARQMRVVLEKFPQSEFARQASSVLEKIAKK